MPTNVLPPPARLKLDLMFEGIRFSNALGAAAEHAFPNYYPYRFRPGEADPTGSGKATIPYLFTTADGCLVRIKGSADSPWVVNGSREQGYTLRRDGTAPFPIGFEPLPTWMGRTTSDGIPMSAAGVALHGDMLVVNVAPGCEYFNADKRDGVSMRCTFCAYGAPDGRSQALGQETGQPSLPDRTYSHLQETLRAALAESAPRHIYLVGGSMTDWHQEADRHLELAERVQAVNPDHVPVTCGSGALAPADLQRLHQAKLVDHVCFNLEVWSESLFSRVCPGKQRFVGYHNWIESLETAVGLWGRGRVYSAMVAGVELEPEHGLSWEQAAELALEGAEDLCSRGILPIYSLYWPVGGRDHPDYLIRLRNYFEHINLGYQVIRANHGLYIREQFMCSRCAYMQLECDIDRLSENQND